MPSVWHECLSHAVYYAPRGRPRLMMLGESIGQRYLSSGDILVGVLGDSGTGKSSLIGGMFPGLELTNDDEGVNVRPVPLIHMHREGRFRAHTFHIDARFETAFAPLHEIADAVRAALAERRRVVVEHFDEVYPLLGMNAQFLVGIGEDIVVTRPDVFGPLPQDVARAIAGTAIYRKMAHSAEDLTAMILEQDFGIPAPVGHSDVPRGFVIEFPGPLDIDIEHVEQRALEVIRAGADIHYEDHDHVRIGDTVYPCSGPHIHVRNTSEIRCFRLVKSLVHDQLRGTYCLVGQVAEPRSFALVERHPEAGEPRPAEATP